MSMPTKRPVQIQTDHTQASDRFVQIFTDQHKGPSWAVDGRPFTAWVEIPAERTNPPMPCTDLIPCGLTEEGKQYAARREPTRREHVISWSAPYLPDMKYADLVRKQYGTFVWRYDQMRRDDLAATEMFYELAADWAIEKNLPIPEPGQPVNYAIRRKVGNLPRSPMIAEAFLAEDPWLLGFTTEPNDRLEALLRQFQTGGRSYVQEAMQSAGSNVLTVTPESLAQMIASEVQKALSANGERPDEPERGAPERVDLWQAFKAEHRGEGHSMKVLGEMFREAKANGWAPTLVGTP